ncbi:MAG: tol-pal system protein YbgF [Deltaproteobacteria bacterium HGW-Deltaproteobacteria-18]|nr:MAG: tol-pal system protein YbgF [Deltaproteobacteria bacterium HGW-Deltaproteobacteria-18]
MTNQSLTFAVETSQTKTAPIREVRMSSFHLGRKILVTGALAALLGTIPACVTTSDFDRLRSQVYSQEQERIKQQDRIAQLEAELARSQPAQANNWAEVNTLRSQLAALTGQVDDLQRTQQMQQEAAGGMVTVDSLNSRVVDLERKTLFMATQLGIVFDEMPPLPPAQSVPNGSFPGTMTSPSQEPEVPGDASQPMTQPAPPVTSAPQAQPETQPQAEVPGQELYQQALESFYAMKYKEAQTTWAEFVKGFPKDPLVPNAIFWQGECFFQMQDYANAVLTYQKVIEDHSKSNKYTAALLKQGISFFKLKKDQAGRLVLEDLIKKHPESAEAKRAQAYLKSGN